MKPMAGTFYKVCRKITSLGNRLMWYSQERMFARIGERCHVVAPLRVRGYEYIHIGDGFYCGEGVRLEAWDTYRGQTFHPIITIGNDVMLTDRCYVSCVDSVSIGDGCLFGRDVFVTDNLHGGTHGEDPDLAPASRPLTSKGPVTIGRNVWIGRQVTVLPGVTIGDNAIVGANSVVSKDVPPNCVVAGVPVRIIRGIGQS